MSKIDELVDVLTDMNVAQQISATADTLGFVEQILDIDNREEVEEMKKSLNTISSVEYKEAIRGVFYTTLKDLSEEHISHYLKEILFQKAVGEKSIPLVVGLQQVAKDFGTQVRGFDA